MELCPALDEGYKSQLNFAASSEDADDDKEDRGPAPASAPAAALDDDDDDVDFVAFSPPSFFPFLL